MVSQKAPEMNVIAGTRQKVNPVSPDRVAFEELIRRNYRVIYAYARSRLGRPESAEDATQESFLRAYRILDRCRDLASAAPWVMAIAKNCVKEELRRVADKPRVRALTASDPSSGLPDAVRQAIDRLRDRPRLVLTLKYVEGLSVLEIARRTGMSVSAVKVMLFRAYEFIRKRACHELP